MTTIFSTWESPVGELTLVAGEDGLRTVSFPGRARDPEWARDDAALAPVAAQLAEYFAGERTAFDLTLAPRGGAFDLSVWKLLQEIPYGETRSYGDLARTLGRMERVRAVGGANGRNPLAIVVPCHRVIGSDGSLTGYGGGLERKRALLDLERGVRSLAVL